RLATYHFAATKRNRQVLIEEGVPADRIFLTGNPVVESLSTIRDRAAPGPRLKETLDRTANLKRLVVTLHRRENFGQRLIGYLQALRFFVEQHQDIVLFFPVHPNPAVRSSVGQV